MTMVSLLLVPPEITEHALLHAHPRDVASFAQTCRFARALVYQSGDQHLWRQLFLLLPFDDPRKLPAITSAEYGCEVQVDWMAELQQRMRASRTISSIETHPEDLLEALKTLISVVHSAAHVSMDSPSDSQSHNLNWLCQVMRDTDIFGSKTCYWSPDEQQLLAQLYCYIGWRDGMKKECRRYKSRNLARGFVYDLRKYSRLNSYGPFLPDKSGRVNWMHVECIITVIDRNLWDLNGRWEHSRPPRTMNSLRAYSAPGVLKRDKRDWAGVEGTWRRYVCFMDYRYGYITLQRLPEHRLT
jgi:hypothetical protein